FTSEILEADAFPSELPNSTGGPVLAMSPLLLFSIACLKWAAGEVCRGEGCEVETSELLQHSAKDSWWWHRHRWGYNRYGYNHYKSYSSYGGKGKKPNILVIIVDDLGFNQVGFRANAVNNSDVVTPNIDQLAGEGIVMDRFYATPWCAPSRGALQTGRLDALNPWVPNNVWNWDPNAQYVDLEGKSRTTPFVGGVQPGTFTIANRLQELGYRNHLNGKWGIGGGAYLNTPMGMGYETFMGWFGDSMERCDGDLQLLLVRFVGNINEEEAMVGCKSFKEALDNVADEQIRRRSRQIIAEHDYEEAPLFLVHALQLMHLPIQYPRRFAPKNLTSFSRPQNEDLRAATYGALEYVDWVVGDLVAAVKEQGQYENTIVFFTSDNGGAIYGGQRVNALFAGGWVGAKLDKNRLSPFTSDTVMSINDLAETLLEMITDRPYPDGGMRNAPGPLTGVPMWKAILQKTQVPRKITYSEVMELRVGPDITDLKKIWFTENNTLISDGNWTPNFPNNSEFIPDLGYKYVRPCSTPYCYFDLYSDPSEQTNLFLGPAEEQALRLEVLADWNLFVINTSRVREIDLNVPTTRKVALWTHMGASGPFLSTAAEPVIPPVAQCWCVWIQDGLAVEDVTHVVFNLYLGPRCVDSIFAQLAPAALPCEPPLRLTQAPMPFNLSEALWAEIGFETSDFESIRQADWLFGNFSTPLPLLLLRWNFALVEGLQAMNNRTGFANWANIEKYPFSLAYTDHCPNFDIFTAPTPVTQVTDWLISGGIFNNPTSGAGNNTESNVTACFPVDTDLSVCPSLDNNPPTVDGYKVPIYNTSFCLEYCVLWNPEVD
ncbi:ARSB, partial [Symbiodinium sp. CCMP2456]